MAKNLTRIQRLLKNFIILGTYIVVLFSINSYLGLNIWITMLICLFPAVAIFLIAVAGIKQGLDVLRDIEDRKDNY